MHCSICTKLQNRPAGSTPGRHERQPSLSHTHREATASQHVLQASSRTAVSNVATVETGEEEVQPSTISQCISDLSLI